MDIGGHRALWGAGEASHQKGFHAFFDVFPGSVRRAAACIRDSFPAAFGVRFPGIFDCLGQGFQEIDGGALVLAQLLEKLRRFG